VCVEAAPRWEAAGIVDAIRRTAVGPPAPSGCEVSAPREFSPPSAPSPQVAAARAPPSLCRSAARDRPAAASCRPTPVCGVFRRLGLHRSGRRSAPVRALCDHALGRDTSGSRRGACLPLTAVLRRQRGEAAGQFGNRKAINRDASTTGATPRRYTDNRHGRPPPLECMEMFRRVLHLVAQKCLS
jgi:hypothetical protein